MVESPPRIAWRKHTDSFGAECVEVGAAAADMLIRDSKDPAGPVIVLTAGGWPSFLLSVTSGRFDHLHSP